MSMQYWPEYGFGLVLTDDGDEIEKFVRSVFNEPEEEDASVYDLIGIQEFEDMGARYFDDENEGKNFFSVGDPDACHEHEPMLVFPADRQPSAFEAVYTKESVVEEFRRKIGKYLPEDFDYLAHIGEYHCVVCC